MSDAIRKVQYYYATIPHRPGTGARLLGAFRDAGVDFLAVHAFPEGGEAQIDFFPRDPGAFERAAEAVGVELSPPKAAFVVQGADRPGAVAALLARLAEAGVNVTAMDAVSSGEQFGALLWVGPDDVDRAARALDAA